MGKPERATVTGEDSAVAEVDGRRERGRLRREQIVREAGRLFHERGFGGVTLQDIAGAAGITVPALYRHFPDKQAILLAVLEPPGRVLWQPIVRVDGDSPMDAVERFIARLVEVTVAHPEVVALSLEQWSSLPKAARSRYRRRVAEMTKVLIGLLRESRPDLADDRARVLLEAAFGSIARAAAAPRTLPAAELEALLARVAHRILTA
jgi:AcrR family transcriptional regulator